MRVGYLQYAPSVGRVNTNLERILHFLDRAVSDAAELMVLPEYCATGYPFKSRVEIEGCAEKIPGGNATETMISYAKEKGTYLVAGMVEKERDKIYNTAILTGPKGFVAKHRKTHLWDDENALISKGDNEYRVYDLGPVRVGLMICYEWRFPEIARILSLKGADLICHPSNLLLPYCQTAMQAAAIQSGVYIITANRTGTERGIRFTGESQIVDPNMRILAKSGRNEEVKVVDIDPTLARNKKITKYNDMLKERRAELFGALLEAKTPVQRTP